MLGLDEYKKIKFNGYTIDEAVKILEDKHNKGVLSYIEIEGVKLYSDSVSREDAYLKLRGSNKYLNEILLKMHLEKFELEEEIFKKYKPLINAELVLSGKMILDFEKFKKWEHVVDELNSRYTFKLLILAIEIIDMLNNNIEFSEARKKLESIGHSGVSEKSVHNLILEFCEHGTDFIDYCDNEE